MRASLQFSPPAMVRPSDEQLVAEAVTAREEAESVEESASPCRWKEAESYAELSKRGWSVRKIAQACGTNRNTVSIFTRAASRYRDSDSRPSFWTAYSAVTGENEPREVHNTGDVEWYTPPEYIAKAREVMGELDLDPASCEAAQKVVQATIYYTAEDDGLAQEWKGRVWMNPPYARGVIERFAEKLVQEVKAGNVEQAVALTNDGTDTGWFHTLAEEANAICFPRKRAKFLKPDGAAGAPLQGQCFFYFGESMERFAEHFADVGLVLSHPRISVEVAA